MVNHKWMNCMIREVCLNFFLTKKRFFSLSITVITENK